MRDRGNERLYALSDQVSVTAIADATGTVLERYGYNAYGAPQFMNASFASIPTSEYGWETLYDSYRFDNESGFCQVRNRYLHTTLGRWLTTDPLAYKDGVNLFAYVQNSPTNNIDPLGLQSCADCESAAASSDAAYAFCGLLVEFPPLAAGCLGLALLAGICFYNWCVWHFCD